MEKNDEPICSIPRNLVSNSPKHFQRIFRFCVWQIRNFNFFWWWCWLTRRNRLSIFLGIFSHYDFNFPRSFSSWFTISFNNHLLPCRVINRNEIMYFLSPLGNFYKVWFQFTKQWQRRVFVLYLTNHRLELPHPIEKQIVLIMPKYRNLDFRKNQNLSQMFNFLDSIPINKHRTNDTYICIRLKIKPNSVRIRF